MVKFDDWCVLFIPVTVISNRTQTNYLDFAALAAEMQRTRFRSRCAFACSFPHRVSRGAVRWEPWPKPFRRQRPGAHRLPFFS